jgi:hypothetical protein
MKPESRFITSVNAKVPLIVHREKMHNLYRGGTFDVWYSGSKSDLWVEYKWIPRVPKRGVVVPNLSALQRQWGRGRYREGRNVFVVLGCPDGCVIYTRPAMWEDGLHAEKFRGLLQSKPAIAAWITSYTTGDPPEWKKHLIE